MQVNGRNYLIPVGAQIEHEKQVEYEAVDVGAVLAEMDNARNRLNIVILDACRDNPFSRSFRSGAQGLASMNAPSGTLICLCYGSRVRGQRWCGRKWDLYGRTHQGRCPRKA